MTTNLYVHFPFCRSKCAYCALPSRAGSDASARRRYVGALVRALAARPADECYRTVYFGGGTPALCPLAPLLDALKPRCAADCEFTVELHPNDVTPALLDGLCAGGVNRISMGVQALEDDVLAAMGRGYTFAAAARAFAAVRARFANAGIDLIAGYPKAHWTDAALERLGDWGLTHCSVYALQNERGLKGVPDDDAALDDVARVGRVLATLGLERYEISNYARAGFACRHNLAVWRGEDYVGLGEAACGRVGRVRTRGVRDGADGFRLVETAVTPEEDRLERTLFGLRTRVGLDARGYPAWEPTLERFVRAGSLVRLAPLVYRLTARGTEVCDAIMAELV